MADARLRAVLHDLSVAANRIDAADSDGAILALLAVLDEMEADPEFARSNPQLIDTICATAIAAQKLVSADPALTASIHNLCSRSTTLQARLSGGGG